MHNGRAKLERLKFMKFERRFKKLRALIKLIRGRLTEKNYKKEICLLRNSAHALSPMRDADVSLKSLQRFRSRQHGKVLRSICDKERKKLINRRKAAYAEESKLRKQVCAGMLRAGQLSQDWRLGKIKRSDVVAGIEASYKRGKNAYHTAASLRSRRIYTSGASG